MTTDSPALATALTQDVWARPASQSWLRPLVLMVAGSLLITLSARLQVPMWPVPMTMQTWAVLLVAAAFGCRLGTATVAFYLAQGAVGLPVFATGGGIGYIAGPTGGYLAGFLAAAALVGWLSDRGWGRAPLRVLAASMAGTAVIFLLGVGWLAAAYTGLEGAIANGLLPFLPGAALKGLLVVLTLQLGWRVLHGRHHENG